MNYRRSKVDKMIKVVRSIMPDAAVQYDFSKLSNKQLLEIIDGVENGTMSDEYLEETLYPVKS